MSANSTVSRTVLALPISPTGHFLIIRSLKNAKCPTAPITKCLTRAIRAVNFFELCYDILHSCLITHPPSTLSDLVVVYRPNWQLTAIIIYIYNYIYIYKPNSTRSQFLNKHAPVKFKIIRTKPILVILRHSNSFMAFLKDSYNMVLGPLL